MYEDTIKVLIFPQIIMIQICYLMMFIVSLMSPITINSMDLFKFTLGRLMGSRVGSRRSTCTGVSSRRSFSQDRPAAAVTAPSRDITHRNTKNNRMAFNAAAPIRTSTALGAQPKKRFG